MTPSMYPGVLACRDAPIRYLDRISVPISKKNRDRASGDNGPIAIYFYVYVFFSISAPLLFNILFYIGF